MSKKVYVLKTGECGKDLTTDMCLGTNDMSKYPVRADKPDEPVNMVAHFSYPYEDTLAYITEDPIEIELITKYLMETQNPFFYDLDNPTNSRNFYKNLPKELL